MFIENKYTKWYFQLIENATNRNIADCYMEKHHIIPKSLGGNDEGNIVTLTAKEHFVAHHLLTKMIEDKTDKGKMWSAFFLMHIGHDGQRPKYAKTYEMSKIQMAIHKSITNSGTNNPYYGKSHTTEIRSKMSDSWNKSAKRNHDITIYTFIHDKHGMEICSRTEICDKYGLNHKRIWTIVNKTQKTANGWSILWASDQIL
jgi:hypothetical protein